MSTRLFFLSNEEGRQLVNALVASRDIRYAKDPESEQSRDAPWKHYVVEYTQLGVRGPFAWRRNPSSARSNISTFVAGQCTSSSRLGRVGHYQFRMF